MNITLYKQRMPVSLSDMPDIDQIRAYLEDHKAFYYKKTDDVLVNEYLKIVGLKVYSNGKDSALIEVIYRLDKDGRVVMPVDSLPDPDDYILR